MNNAKKLFTYGIFQNLWGTRAGFKNGAKSFFGRQKGEAETFCDEKNVGGCPFFDWKKEGATIYIS